MTISLKDQYKNKSGRMLFDAYSAAQIPDNATYEKNRDAAQKFLATLDPAALAQLKRRFPEFEPEMFDNTGGETQLIRKFVGFSNFNKAVYDVLNDSQPVFSGMTGVVRRKFPDAKAFQLVGMNDLSISDEPANYLVHY